MGNSEESHEAALQLTRSDAISIRTTSDKGRGVFAARDIAGGTLLEVSPVLVVKGEEYKQHTLNKTVFESYLFTWSRSAGDMALALGIGSLFNHSDTSPNVSYELDKQNGTIRYSTSRDIKQGEELCIYYGHGVHFGAKGELLVGRTRSQTPETEHDALQAFGGLLENEHDVVPLEKLPLQHVTRILKPEDMPLETVDVYVLQSSPRESGAVVAGLKALKMDVIPELKHLRRIRRIVKDNIDIAQTILCPVSMLSAEELAEKLAAHPAFANMPVTVHAVPASPARTPDQAKEWTRSHWPVSFVPVKDDVLARSREESWTAGKLAWTESVLNDLVKMAESASKRGELPVACIVTESWDPTRHTVFNPPIALASSTDTRKSTGNPLKHSVMTLLEEVAALDRNGTRPGVHGAGYLLTGLTVFMSHEPCLLCSMALLHSRIATLVYIRPSPGAGGCGTEYSLHEEKTTNHRFEVWRVKGDGTWVEWAEKVPKTEADP